MSPSIRRHRLQPNWTLGLAVVATSTALCMSVLAGWQRGGWLAERLVWVAIGVVLVVSAHLLPALLRDAPPGVRGIGNLLWVACLATACYGHAAFFVLAQEHAGEQRASTTIAASFRQTGRSLTVVMSERATVTRQLAFAQAQRCARDCSALAARRMTLTAKCDALNAESDDIRRRQAADDRVAAQRDALRADPVTSQLAALLGTTTPRIDLLSGLAFAAVLEGVACLLWTVALRSPPVAAAVPIEMPPEIAPVADVTHVTQPRVTAITPSQASKTVSREGVTDGDVTQLARDVEAGRVRPTVADIRRYLGCSQTRAATLRRQLVSLPV